MLQQVIISLECFGPDRLFDEGQSEEPPQHECEPGPGRETYCGIQGAPKGPIKIAPDQAGYIARNGCENDLEKLHGDENDDVVRVERSDEGNRFFLAEEIDVEMKMNEYVCPEGEEQDQDG